MSQNLKEQRLLDFFYSALDPVQEYLYDDDVTDIMLNPDGALWVDTFSKGLALTGKTMSAEEGEHVIRVAGGIKKHFFNEQNPSVSVELPGNGERFQGIMPPESETPIFSIRKKPAKIFSLDDYVAEDILTKRQQTTIKAAIAERKNILIAGSTGSGKTTFANAILKEMATLKTRIAILEDTKELQCSAKNSYNLKTSDTVNMRQLLKHTLRMNIDSIIIGEVRGGEALDLLKAWNTGHPGGVATIHSDSALDALYRLEQLILEVVSSSQTSLISRAVDVVVFLTKNKQRKRYVKEILRVNGLQQEDSPYQVEKCV